MSEENVFQFGGVATVTVTCKIEAETEEEARLLLKRGECEWVCDEVDGAVSDIDLIGVL